ncbi:hypothetical protein [Algoriphagus litoralis]|uniref:hypothetical protein n=1 Tax=Algoriphagus litoralis TaxID=2202829 RepID=UPI000DBA0BDF|nr:hypothetical protein [Algoriphagus litoralis]
MAEKKPIPFRIKGIETTQFALIEASFKQDCEVELAVGVPISASDDDHAIQVSLNIQFKCESAPFIILEVKMKFEIEPAAFQTLIMTKKKKLSVVIPVGLARHLASLIIGTARGVLHERLSKTKFYELVLPTIDLTKILEEDIVLEKREE